MILSFIFQRPVVRELFHCLSLSPLLFSQKGRLFFLYLEDEDVGPVNAPVKSTAVWTTSTTHVPVIMGEALADELDHGRPEPKLRHTADRGGGRHDRPHAKLGDGFAAGTCTG